MITHTKWSATLRAGKWLRFDESSMIMALGDSLLASRLIERVIHR